MYHENTSMQNVYLALKTINRVRWNMLNGNLIELRIF